eukprot:TRINITY_DN5069_c0_g2_i3.p2 TRINITY_DN5069_c0_g2~~TRINITY_DN5069_c0_g2_i3.p2  ORF type:complete len:161 (-),score=9.67 TRINITY_DN5069_c0_g2_i3:277-759(-)
MKPKNSFPPNRKFTTISTYQTHHNKKEAQSCERDKGIQCNCPEQSFEGNTSNRHDYIDYSQDVTRSSLRRPEAKIKPLQFNHRSSYEDDYNPHKQRIPNDNLQPPILIPDIPINAYSTYTRDFYGKQFPKPIPKPPPLPFCDSDPCSSCDSRADIKVVAT